MRDLGNEVGRPSESEGAWEYKVWTVLRRGSVGRNGGGGVGVAH